MKRTLILSIVALTILAFATAADAAPCEAYDRDIVSARATLTSAKADLRMLEDKHDLHMTVDHIVLPVLSGESSGSFCTTCLENAFAKNQLKAAIKTAKEALDRAQRVHDTCMASYSCSSCNQMGVDHALKPQPGCNHMVYSCQSDSGTHTQLVCSRCNQTYWQCGSDASNHTQATGKCGHTYWRCDTNADTHIQIRCDNNLRRAEVRNASYERVILYYRRGCGQKFWLCKNFAGHNTITYCSTHPNVGKYGCQSNYACSSAHGSSSGGSTGTTTSPTVSNNGGSVSNGGGGGSDTRVRCGHGNACSRGGYASSRYAHKTTCPAGHRYYACSSGGASKHANCRARQSGEVACARGSWCRSGGYASSRTAHRTTCAAGHTYWTCSPSSVRRHRNCRS